MNHRELHKCVAHELRRGEQGMSMTIDLIEQIVTVNQTAWLLLLDRVRAFSLAPTTGTKPRWQ